VKSPPLFFTFMCVCVYINGVKLEKKKKKKDSLMVALTDTTWDIVALSVQVVITIVVLVLSAYVCLVIDRLQSVRGRDVSMIMCAVVSGLVWMWSAFVSDMHLSALLPLNRWGCALWDFWLQYAFGLNLMLTFIIIKLNWYRLLLTHCSPYYIRRNMIQVVSLCMLPIILVCVGVEYNQATTVDRKLGICITEPGWKYALITTLGLNYLAMLYLLYRTMSQDHVSSAHKELVYGSCVATAALLLILTLNLTHQTLLMYGRVLKSLAIDVCCLSLFAGLIGMPIFSSLRRKNEYEMVSRAPDAAVSGTESVACMADIIRSEQAYEHYLEWVQYRYGKDEPWSINSSSLCPPVLLDSGSYDDRYNNVFCGYTTCHDTEDPPVFLLKPAHVIRLLRRIGLVLDSSRAVDASWRCDIQKKFLMPGGEKHVRLPYNLWRLLIESKNLNNYKTLLLCTKLWLLSQMERLTWNEYMSDSTQGLNTVATDLV